MRAAPEQIHELPHELLETRAALGRLSPRKRAAVVLRYFVDIPDAEIADVLGCRPGTVRTLLHRAINELREDLSAQWRTLADSPLSPRSEQVAVWADDQMIVVGGSNFTGAAAYDPASDTWSMLAAPPSTIERQADIAWTGEQLIVWARESTRAAGLIYDRTADEWRQLPPLPAELAVSRGSMSWTGTEVIVWGATANNKGESVGARIRPGNDEWQAIAADPLGPYDRWNGADGSSNAVWTGTEVLIWAGAVGTDADATATPTLAYNSATDSWRQFDDAAKTWHHPQMLWTGEAAVVLTSPLLAIAPDGDLQSSAADSRTGIAVEDLPDPIDLSVLSVRPNNLSLDRDTGDGFVADILSAG